MYIFLLQLHVYKNGLSCQSILLRQKYHQADDDVEWLWRTVELGRLSVALHVEDILCPLDSPRIGEMSCNSHNSQEHCGQYISEMRWQ